MERAHTTLRRDCMVAGFGCADCFSSQPSLCHTRKVPYCVIFGATHNRQRTTRCPSQTCPQQRNQQRLKAGEEPPKPFVAGGVGDRDSTATTRRRSSARRGSVDGGGQGSEEGEGDGGGRRGSQHLNRRASRALRVSLLQVRLPPPVKGLPVTPFVFRANVWTV